MITRLRQAGVSLFAPVCTEKPRRFALDNAGKLYPSVATKKWSSVYRVSVQMREVVEASALQRASDRVLPRFPTIAVRLRRGFFWYALEENSAPFYVRKDAGLYCSRFRWHENEGYLFRILYSGRNISVEFFHALTDGYGAQVFVKTLVAEYLRQCGHAIPTGKGVLDIAKPAPEQELEDAFLCMPLPKEGLPRGGARAYHLVGGRMPSSQLAVTVVRMSAAEVLGRAKAVNATVTEYISSAMLLAAVQLQQKEQPEHYKPVRISIPVNMRGYFDTPTLRNFSYYVNPEINEAKASGVISFTDMLSDVKAFLAHTLTPEYLFAGINTNVAPEKLAVVRLTPLPIKNLVLRAVFRANAGKLVTTTLTNLGRVDAPEELLAHVDHLSYMLGPSAHEPGCNAALTTTGDIMSLVFSRDLDSDAFPKNVIRFLESEGIELTVK